MKDQFSLTNSLYSLQLIVQELINFPLQIIERAPRRGEQVRKNRNPRLEDEYPPRGPIPPCAGRGRNASRPDIPERGDRIPLPLRSHGRFCGLAPASLSPNQREDDAF